MIGARREELQLLMNWLDSSIQVRANAPHLLANGPTVMD
jgi:hypothetical protein